MMSSPFTFDKKGKITLHCPVIILHRIQGHSAVRPDQWLGLRLWMLTGSCLLSVEDFPDGDQCKSFYMSTCAKIGCVIAFY
uniref:E3 ubiquitin-protein ligase BRE1-like 1 n=1 Tax=Rhizophora mucronata TaxID=61149 RepID=A0A2P2JCZ1_RHIMU